MAGPIPENTEKFNELMLTIDRHLASLGCGIPQRPIAALGEVSKRYSLPLPITEPLPRSNHEAAPFWPVSVRIYDWYKKRYGERLKISLSPGRMAILVEDDLWVLRIPRIYGAVNLTVSRTIQSSRSHSTKGPVVYNVVDALENMPSSRVRSMPDNELEHIFEKFTLGLQAFGLIEGSASQHELVRSATADIGAAVDHLMATPAQYGLSKWSSLQATEKAMKAAISLTGGTYSNTHCLARLGEQAENSGLTNRWSILTPHIQCSPGIRYGDEICDRDSAVRAHHASLALIIQLHHGGAIFDSNLALQWTR